MAIEKQVNIKVTETGLDELNSDLKKLDNNLANVSTEANKTSKSVDDVAGNGGAIAVLDSLTGGLATRFKDAYEASKLFNFSLKATRGALIATGIGAFVVALGLVVGYWGDIKDFITGSNRALERQLSLTKKLGDEQQRELDILDKQNNILKLQGKSQLEINNLKKKELADVIAIREQELELAKVRLQSLIDLRSAGGSALEGFSRTAQALFSGLAKSIDSILSKVGLSTGFEESSFGISETIIESVFGSKEDLKEAEDRVKDLEDGILSARDRLAGITLENQDLTKPERETGEGIDLKTTEEQDAIRQKEAEFFEEQLNLKKWREEQLTNITLGEEVKRSAEAAKESQKRIDQSKWEADERERLEMALSNAKVDIAQNTLALIGAIAGEGSAVGKAVAVAQATIKGIEGVQNAYTTAQSSPITAAFPAYPIVQAGLAAAFSAVQIKKILTVDPTGKSQPNLGGGGASGGASPSFNVVGASGTNQLAQSLQQDKDPIQAFVVGSNVTSQQALDRNIKDTATIG